MGTPGGKTQILAENDPKYWYYAKILLVLAIRIHKVTTHLYLGLTLMQYLRYQLYNSWGEPYKWAPWVTNTQTLSENDSMYVDIMLKIFQFGLLDNT